MQRHNMVQNRLLHLDEVTVYGDETYGGVVLWAFEKP